MRYLLLASILASATAHADVVITGRVDAVMNGKPAAAAPEGGLWVYVVDKGRPHVRTRDAPTATISQKSYAFDPHVSVVPKDTAIEFPNLDSEDHNVFSPDPFFDLERYGHGKKKTRKFTALGEQQIYCDIHKCMWARVLVVDVPDFSRIQHVGADGTYRFDKLPAGTYEVYAWAVASQPVGSGKKLVADGTAWTADPLHVQLGKLDLDHNNKFNQPYKPDYHGRCPP